MTCTKLSLVFNIFLFFLKLFAGIVGRSQALVADALNSLLDIVANIVVWLGIHIAGQPPDKNHPYGHGNADTLAAVFVALVLLLTGGYIGRESIHAVIDGHYTTPTFLATAAALLTIIIKETLYRYTHKIGKKYKSQAVLANAADHRSDVIVSTGALVGIVVAQLGVPVLDPIAGLWVAVFIFKQAIKIIRDNIQTLMVTSPGKAVEHNISEFIAGIDGVRRVAWVKGRLIGSGYYLDAAIKVDGEISVDQGHDIASDIRKAVRTNFPDVIDIMVHIEPYRTD